MNFLYIQWHFLVVLTLLSWTTTKFRQDLPGTCIFVLLCTHFSQEVSWFLLTALQLGNFCRWVHYFVDLRTYLHVFSGVELCHMTNSVLVSLGRQWLWQVVISCSCWHRHCVRSTFGTVLVVISVFSKIRTVPGVNKLLQAQEDVNTEQRRINWIIIAFILQSNN